MATTGKASSAAPPGRPDTDEGQAIEKRVIAIHEAGHAVAHMALGLGIIGRITLTVTGTFEDRMYASFGGSVTVRTRPDRSYWQTNNDGDLRDYATVCSAGPAAERRYCLDFGIHDNSHVASETDRQRLLKIGRRRSKHNAPLFGLDVFLRARTLMQQPNIWQAVLAVADALCELWPDWPDEPGEVDAVLDGEVATKLISKILGQ